MSRARRTTTWSDLTGGRDTPEQRKWARLASLLFDGKQLVSTDSQEEFVTYENGRVIKPR